MTLCTKGECGLVWPLNSTTCGPACPRKSAMTRDPLIDPQPGDRVRARCLLLWRRTRHVAQVDEYEDWVRFWVEERRGILRYVYCTVSEWCSWCRRNKAVEVKE